jgi:hypothetical protein
VPRQGCSAYALPALAAAGGPGTAVCLLLLLGAGPREEAERIVVSRHSGEVLAGDDFAVSGAPEGRRAIDLAQAVRMEVEAGGGERRTGPDFALDLDPDRIVVRRSDRLSIPAATRGEAAVEVQVFGLVGSDRVSVTCPGRGVRIQGSTVEELASGWQTLGAALGTGKILCSGGPWQVRVAGSAARPYAGVFSFRPLPDRPPEPRSTRREARARRGSEVIFCTTLADYVSGVMAAEHAGLDGEAAVTLARVIAHDARVERHPGRPLCDTTHCQAFLGTAAPTAEVRRALALPELPTTRWLPYFRGGSEPWEVRRPAAEVRALLGDAQRFGGDGRTLEVVRSTGVERRPCEPVRATLRLPSCPTEGLPEGETFRIRGRGRGHGLGLDVEAARTSGLTAAELLRRAYGLD